MHSDLLCHHSTYFKAALKSGSKESLERKIKLDDISNQTMESFASWLYGGKLYDAKTEAVDPDSNDADKRTSVNLSGREIVDIWLFGGRMGIAALQNDAIDIAHQYGCERWQTLGDQIPRIYSNTITGARLREYIVEDYVRVGGLSGKSSNESPELQVLDFLKEVCQRFWNIRENHSTVLSWNKSDWEKIDLCQFHVHDKLDCKGQAVEIVDESEDESSPEPSGA